MRFLAITLSALMLSGCSSAVYMQHAKTGQVVKCGPYPQGVSAAGSALREIKCVDDFKQQGFRRIPKP